MRVKSAIKNWYRTVTLKQLILLMFGACSFIYGSAQAIDFFVKLWEEHHPQAHITQNPSVFELSKGPGPTSLKVNVTHHISNIGKGSAKLMCARSSVIDLSELITIPDFNFGFSCISAPSQPIEPGRDARFVTSFVILVKGDIAPSLAGIHRYAVVTLVEYKTDQTNDKSTSSVSYETIQKVPRHLFNLEEEDYRMIEPMLSKEMRKKESALAH